MIRTKNTKRNQIRVNLIKSALTDFKNKIKNKSKNEIEFEQINEIVNIVEKILEFNEQKHQWSGLKISTPNQMLSTLPIYLAQLKAGNNSEKLKTEIRQQLYSLNRWKKLTKTSIKVWLTLKHGNNFYEHWE